MDRGQRPRLPLSLPDLRAAGEPPAAYATRMKQAVRALLHAAQEGTAALDRNRVDTTFRVGCGPAHPVMLRAKELLDAAEVGKLRPRRELLEAADSAPRWASCDRGGPLWLRSPAPTHTPDPPCAVQVQSGGQRPSPTVRGK